MTSKNSGRKEASSEPGNDEQYEKLNISIQPPVHESREQRKRLAEYVEQVRKKTEPFLAFIATNDTYLYIISHLIVPKAAASTKELVQDMDMISMSNSIKTTNLQSFKTLLSTFFLLTFLLLFLFAVCASLTTEFLLNSSLNSSLITFFRNLQNPSFISAAIPIFNKKLVKLLIVYICRVLQAIDVETY